MPTTSPPHPQPDTDPVPPLDHRAAEGFAAAGPDELSASGERRDWTLVAVGLAALVAVMAAVIAFVGLAPNDSRPATSVKPAASAPAPDPGATAAAPTLADAKGVAFEEFTPVDATLPAIPPGR